MIQVLKLNYSQKRDRVKLFIIILTLFSGISLLFLYLSGYFDSPETQISGESKKSVKTIPEASESIKNSGGIQTSDGTANAEHKESKELLSNNEIEKTQSIATEFIKAYYEFDITKPRIYPESVKDLMSDKLYAQENKYVRREKENSKVTSTKVLPVDQETAGEVIWSVTVNEEQEFFVSLKKYKEGWKVTAFNIEGDGH
ncbi:hypothetical protein M5X00_24250 [Paenibacillus alvei]|uniref:DUF4878 domain-containing protein n=1 Tax=Paenibacillus alvei TaxID=44250 RepID=A0ABT4H7F2_PAEAL|nr:hypothetical protein [Paenibacillus alvei]EJW14355.1 hypothetical protein PAV_14c00480 [Paenibacillus alvei DSM 29]MCY9542834.1 hypothetical protein [Paenibacillus alvei]MCY9736111.1 hypothetical protein [Paenibacillus alvei]MCY9757342.1 hypothetical protein [Paenibacillus alvei]MCY9764918.1 hypothetical protein [Paenibacillus alvei]